MPPKKPKPPVPVPPRRAPGITPRVVGPVNRRRETERTYAGKAGRHSRHYIRGYDYQCPNCGKVFRGPDEGWIPGTEIAHGRHGEKVVHDLCLDCGKKTRYTKE